MKAYELQGPAASMPWRWSRSRCRRRRRTGAGEAEGRHHQLSRPLTVKGGYGSRQKFPLIPLSGWRRRVESVGAGVTAFKPGDRVTGSFFRGLARRPAERSQDALQSRRRARRRLVRIPHLAFRRAGAHAGYLSDVEAASLPCAGLTAWSAVAKLGDIRPGQIVLTQGTGGVSIFALQFAKMSGARVIATSSSEAKIEKLKALGADVTINYKTTRNGARRCGGSPAMASTSSSRSAAWAR